MTVEALTITGNLTRQDEIALTKIFNVIADRHPEAAFSLSFTEKSHAKFEGLFTEADLVELLVVYRAIERQRPDELLTFFVTKTELSTAEIEAMAQRIFPRLENDEPIFATIPFTELHLHFRDRLPMWVIYNQNTSDYPGQWVARLHLSLPAPVPTQFVMTEDSLDELRKKLPSYLTRLARSENDDANIVEIWL